MKVFLIGYVTPIIIYYMLCRFNKKFRKEVYECIDSGDSKQVIAHIFIPIWNWLSLILFLIIDLLEYLGENDIIDNVCTGIVKFFTRPKKEKKIKQCKLEDE